MSRSRSWLLLALLLLAAQTAHPEVFVGLRKGVHLGFHTLSEGQDDDGIPMPGFTGGLVVGIPVRGSLEVRPQLLLSGKGATNRDDKISARMTTVDFPVLLRSVMSLPPDWLDLAILMGPFGTYRLAGSVNNDGFVEVFEDSSFYRFDVGVIAGLELAARVRGAVFSLDVRFEHGFVPLFQDEDDDSRFAALTIGLGGGLYFPRDEN